METPGAQRQGNNCSTPCFVINFDLLSTLRRAYDNLKPNPVQALADEIDVPYEVFQPGWVLAGKARCSAYFASGFSKIMTCRDFSWVPLVTRMESTVPSMSARRGCSIFMASTMARVAPLLTC